MSINPITFGVPVYDPPFSVSTGDVDNLKLRSKETAPLSHESLDENFCNLANKINEILNLGISDVSITNGVISAANLQVSGSGVIAVSGTGVISHADRTAENGYNVATLDGTTNAVVNGLITDSNGHVTGYKTRDIDLSAYATTDSLSGYATTSSLSSYATTTALATTDGNVSTNTSSISTLTSSVSTNTTNIGNLQTSVATLDSEKLDIAALSFDSNTGTLTITTS